MLFVLARCACAATDANDLLVLNGKVYSVTELRALGNEYLKSQGIDLIIGKVTQSARGGVLVSIGEGSTRERFTSVFVEAISGVADGDRFGQYAVESGLMEYTSVLGAKKTVRKFTPEAKPTEDQLKKYQFLQTLEKDDKERRAKADAIEERAKAEARRQELVVKMDAAKLEANAKQFALDAKVAAAYRKRADTGDANSQHELALRYLSGKGVGRDEKEAVRLLKLAAAQGHKAAQKQLDGMKSTTP